MSRGDKTSITGLLLLAALLLFTWLYVPAEVRALNDILEADETLSSYAYPFRVLSVEGETAVMSSPRSVDVPVPIMIHAIDPALAGVSISEPAYQQAQQTLADHQAHAAALVTATDGINRIRWQLDTIWLQQHGIAVPVGY